MNQTNEVYSYYEQGKVYQYFKLHDHGAWVIFFLLWRGHISHYSEYLLAEVYASHAENWGLIPGRRVSK